MSGGVQSLPHNFYIPEVMSDMFRIYSSFNTLGKHIITIRYLWMKYLIVIASSLTISHIISNIFVYRCTDRIWLDVILHIGYNLEIFKDDKKLLSYKYPEDIFDTGIVRYDNVTSTKSDPFKKIIKILMVMENINKNTLRSEEVIFVNAE